MRRQLDLLDGNIHLQRPAAALPPRRVIPTSRRLVRLSTDKLPFGLRSFSAAFCSSPASAYEKGRLCETSGASSCRRARSCSERSR
jgi:hypothetical protein